MGHIAVQSASGDMAPENLAFGASINALHDAVVRIHAGRIKYGNHARADALILLGTRVKNQERLANQLVAGGTEHFADMPVAVQNKAVSRQHQAHRRQVKSQFVIR